MLGLKISIATVFLLSLIIPFLIKPINGLYDIDQLKGLRAYCFLHADRAAQGENVVNDLIKSGLANSTYYDWSCSKISEEIEAESQRALTFELDCFVGNLSPSQSLECYNADKLSSSAELCNFDNTDDPLTPAERVECVNECYLPNRDHELWRDCGDEDEDEDTKEGDK